MFVLTHNLHYTTLEDVTLIKWRETKQKKLHTTQHRFIMMLLGSLSWHLYLTWLIELCPLRFVAIIM